MLAVLDITGQGVFPLSSVGFWGPKGPCAPGDACECLDDNGDGVIGAADLAVLLGSWGPVDAGECQDADDNGLTDAFDLAVLLGNWGPCE